MEGEIPTSFGLSSRVSLINLSDSGVAAGLLLLGGPWANERGRAALPPPPGFPISAAEFSFCSSLIIYYSSTAPAAAHVGTEDAGGSRGRQATVVTGASETGLRWRCMSETTDALAACQLKRSLCVSMAVLASWR